MFSLGFSPSKSCLIAIQSSVLFDRAFQGSRAIACFVMFVVCPLLNTGLSTDPVDTVLKATFCDSVLAGLKQIEALHDKTHFAWTERRVDFADESKISNSSGSNAYRGRNFVIYLNDKGDEAREAFGGNDRNMFVVSKNANQARWALDLFSKRSDDPSENGDVEYGTFSRIPFEIFDTPVRDLVRSPSFVIESLNETREGSVELKFSCDPDDSTLTLHDRRNPRLSSGKIVFIRNRDWRISSYEAKLTKTNQPTAPPVIVSASVEYHAADQDVLNIERSTYEMRWVSNEKPFGIRWEWSVTAKPCDEPPTSFTLFAFGLPEPAFASKSSDRNIFLLLTFAAVVCILFAYVVKRFLMKQNTH